jgi:murein DD-endopeptidase MepM/ murein hydrolase activator NlpD
MKNFGILVFFVFFNFIAAGQPPKEIIILDEPGFPFIFEIDPGDNQIVERSYKGKKVKQKIELTSVQAFSENNYWFKNSLEQSNYYQFQVNLKIGRKLVSLYHRPYQMPVTVEGLRIYVENVKQLDESALYGKCGDMIKQVRISVCLEDEPWGPEDIVFPIDDYIWRSAVYNNTWSSLVPFNQLYYHRGEDYGAIPDYLNVVSPVDGIIFQTPLPDGDGQSNAIYVEGDNGLRFRLSHMNIESIQKKYSEGTQVKAGTILAKTGMTWSGKRSQVSDPHLHIDITIRDVKLASFPFLMEAYLRKYPEPILAIAGGYRFACPGQPVQLDAGRTISRDNQSINDFKWNLSNGKIVNDKETTIIYDKPGLYSEELLVENEEGYQDRDFLYVRVSDSTKARNIAYGWAYYYPLRGIKPGMEILFWNRLINTCSDVKINFGDNLDWFPITKEIIHKYDKTGKYVVTLKSNGPGDEPVSLKMEVVVE